MTPLHADTAEDDTDALASAYAGLCLGATTVAPLTKIPADLPAAELIPLADGRQKRSRNARAALVVDALEVSAAALAVMRESFANGTADMDDAIKVLPITHNLIAHVEKLEAARNVKPNWPSMNIEFTPNGGFILHSVTSAAESAPRLLETDD